MKRLFVPILVAVVGAALFSGLMYIDFYRSLDSRFYDLMLRIRPAIEEDESLLLLEVDDQTITEVNVYPLPRNVFADGLVLMKEFSPAWTMLDIEFVDASEEAIDFDRLGMLPDEVTSTFENLTVFQRQLVEMILSGQVRRADALQYLNDLETSGWDAADELKDQIGKLTYSRDDYLGQAIAYLGNVSATVNMIEDIDNTIPPELREWAIGNRSVNDSLVLNDDIFDASREILPSIRQVIETAPWAGFPRMHIDSDGVRRRVDVLYQYDGNYFTHMGFGTWWYRSGKPPITVGKGRVEVGELTIPLDRDGKMLINWPKRLYDGTPLNRAQARGYDISNPIHRLSFYYLYQHDLLWSDLVNHIDELEYYGITADRYGDNGYPLGAMNTDLEGMLQEMLVSGDSSRAGEYRGYRDEYLELVNRFLSENTESAVMNELLLALDIPDLPAEEAAFYSSLSDRIPELFAECRSILTDLLTVRDFLDDRLNGATLVAGYTGTSTTDYGANPFERKYMNMGIYGAVYNSLLQGEFLAESPIWLIALVSLVAGLIAAVLGSVAVKKSGLNTAIGGAFLILALALAGLVFVFFGMYINLLPLLLTLLATFLTAQAVNFLSASREKAYIQDAFGQIISPEVVREIEKNPDRLKIGGDRRVITAMFTDIEKFSTISEKLGSSDKLFEFLRRYLTPMSDIILDEGGTIDKFEGDAIIAFWNAPLDQIDHAERACRAAMRMVKMEEKIHQDLMNNGLMPEEAIPSLTHGRLYTRIGINTGENNIGFIGTDRKKDYTALGDDMNLSARLEGVNKVYGTQVLISETTEKIIHNFFITRKLDDVRVVGKDLPVGLYELSYLKKFPEDFDRTTKRLEAGETEYRLEGFFKGLNQGLYKNEFSEVERECFNYYHRARALFTAKKWDEAEELFNLILEKLPGDGPTKVFVDRCQKFRVTPPPANWDGVYKLETK